MMKSTNKNLRFRKIKVAKVNTFTIVGGAGNTAYPYCAPAPSTRPPRDGKTQQTSADGNCDTTET